MALRLANGAACRDKCVDEVGANNEADLGAGMNLELVECRSGFEASSSDGACAGTRGGTGSGKGAGKSDGDGESDSNNDGRGADTGADEDAITR